MDIDGILIKILQLKNRSADCFELDFPGYSKSEIPGDSGLIWNLKTGLFSGHTTLPAHLYPFDFHTQKSVHMGTHWLWIGDIYVY